MFVFELRVSGEDSKEHVLIDEIEFVRLLRILKIRNQKLYKSFNAFYDEVTEI
jgi:hypothetical protein